MALSPPNTAGPKMRKDEHDRFFGFSALNGNGYGCWLAKTNLLPSFLLLLLNLVSHTSVPSVSILCILFHTPVFCVFCFTHRVPCVYPVYSVSHTSILCILFHTPVFCVFCFTHQCAVCVFWPICTHTATPEFTTKCAEEEKFGV